MSSDAAGTFLDRLIADPELRGRFRSDPEGTMIAAGLDEHQRRELDTGNWADLPDAELAQRVSKTARGHL
jgi:hypothetical protein